MRTLLGAALVLIVSQSPSWATTYYAGAVSDCGGTYACGNDSNDGLSTSTPKTLKTLVGTVVAGDTIQLLCGTYTDSTATVGSTVFDFTNSGTDGSPITAKSYAPLCARIALYQDNELLKSWAIENRNYITFDGLDIDGRLSITTCTGCVVKNSRLRTGAWDGSSIITALAVSTCTTCFIQDNFCGRLIPRTNSIYDIAGSHNNSCMMLFINTTNTIVEHNYIEGEGPMYTDSTTGGTVRGAISWAGVGEKGGGMVGNIYRRNIITGTNYCFQGMASTNGAVRSGGQDIYENLCTKTVFGGVEFDHQTYDYNVYNNTFSDIGTLNNATYRGGVRFGSSQSASLGSGDNLDHIFTNNIWDTTDYIYRIEPSFLPTYSACRVTNLLAPWPTLTASGSGGSLATGTYWVRISTVTDGVETGTGVARSVAVTGPNGSITVDFDRTATVTGGPDSYRVYYGTTDYSQNTYISVTATGSAGDAQTGTITGSGGTTLAYTKSLVNQWQWIASLASSNYNAYNNIDVGGTAAFARYQSGSTSYATTLAAWQSATPNIGNAGTCIAGYDLNSISADPLFTDGYKLSLSSTLRGAGQSGVHIGAYPADVVSGGYGMIGPRNGYWVVRWPQRVFVAQTSRPAKN